MHKAALILFLTAAFAPAQQPANLAMQSEMRLVKARPLPLDSVRLTGGPLKHAQDLELEYLLALEPNRMLAFLRRAAKLEPKAQGYGGWDGDGRQLTGHIAGHYLSGVSLAFAATADPRYKERVDYIVNELKLIQDAQSDGYLGALMDNDRVDGKSLFEQLSKGIIRSGGFDLNGMWSPWYVQHKIYAGLRDAYRYILQILRHAHRSHRGLEGALGIFGLDSRAACFVRVGRLLDSERPIQTRLSRWTLCGMILLAIVSLPHLRAAEKEKQPVSKTDTEAVLAKDTKSFELRVVGPDGKPVPEALVEIRTDPHPTAEQILQGKFVKPTNYGSMVTTDSRGHIVLKLPQTPSRFEVNITTPGYGPYWASWSSESHPQPIPATFTAELDAGWSVGGIVVNSEGKPLPGVTIKPNIKFKNRPGNFSELHVGTNLKTDVQGKWRFDSVPASMKEVFVEINHPGFMPNRRPLTPGEFGIEKDWQPISEIILDGGLTITGTVTDEEGNPIVGALIRTKFLNDIRETKTGNDGTYRLTGCEPVPAKIVVSAKGRATDKKELRLAPEMEPVDFQMKPGGTVRIRVLDDQGTSVPGARILFQRWRGDYSYFEFGHVNQYANDQGVWEWNEAPLDEFKADICQPGGMELSKQPLISRQQEYVFRVPPVLVISGTVIDAETKEPIKTFQVVPGVRSSQTHMNWARSERFTATDGKYQIRHVHDYFAHLVRIEAEGYQPAVSRDIKSNEGNVSIDFELKKGQDVAATVVMPDGKPAAQAQIALGVAGTQIYISDGTFAEGATTCARQYADATGQFRFPPQETEFQLVVLHETGYAHVKATPEAIPTTIQLEPWARVEGTFRIGKDLAPNVPLTINTFDTNLYGKDVPNISTHHDVITEQDGKFVFERVIPGRGSIGPGISISVDKGVEGVTSAGRIITNFPPGETTRINLGGTGRAVDGRLRLPEGRNDKVNWNFALIEVVSYLPIPPKPNDPPIPADVQADPAKKAEWLQKWQQQTKEGHAWMVWEITKKEIQNRRDNSPRFTASINPNGIFRIDDMPAGKYALSVRFFFNPNPIGQLKDHLFTVPPTEDDKPGQPLDLGVLTLK